MPTPTSPSDARERGGLTIGDLAERTGVSVAVLRSWERRHGFPRAVRLPSGHRRFTEDEVGLVERVQARRAAGIRLETAIEDVLRTTRLRIDSVYAAVRRIRPDVPPLRLRRSTLVVFSHAIEDQCAALASEPVLFAGFQDRRALEAALPRWADLATRTRAAVAFAAVDDGPVAAPPRGVTVVPIDADSPLRREWFVVADAPDLAVALVAWQVPGDDITYEATWTLDPDEVRVAARACAGAALAAGAPGQAELVAHLADPPHVQLHTAAADLLTRVLAEVDRAGA